MQANWIETYQPWDITSVQPIDFDTSDLRPIYEKIYNRKTLLFIIWFNHQSRSSPLVIAADCTWGRAVGDCFAWRIPGIFYRSLAVLDITDLDRSRVWLSIRLIHMFMRLRMRNGNQNMIPAIKSIIYLHARREGSSLVVKDNAIIDSIATNWKWSPLKTIETGVWRKRIRSLRPNLKS